MARFGLPGLLPATVALRARFRGARARAVLAGCAAHSILPLERPLTAAVAMIFALTGARRGLAGRRRRLAGDRRGARVATCASSAAASRPARRSAAWPTFRRRASSSSTPARRSSPTSASRSCPPATCAGCAAIATARASSSSTGRSTGRSRGAIRAASTPSTVHVGGTLEEIAAAEAAVWRGEHPERPFVLVVQQSQFDPSRAPGGQAHRLRLLPRAGGIDRRLHRGDRAADRALRARASAIASWRATRMTPADLERDNPNYVGGAITGGVADLFQFFTRPVARLDPYSTPNPRLFLCSASTPPGGGVHGMCGYFAARSALRRLR